MSPVDGVGSQARDISAILGGRGVTDSRTIHFGANESKEDRMRRIEEITKGNPNVKLDPEAFQKLMRGGDVDVTLSLESPDRRNLYIGAFASLAQLAGGMGGAAYNDALGSAVLDRNSGDGEYVAKHGNNYKMGLFGGASAQNGNIQVAENKPAIAPSDPIVADKINKNLELQAASIFNPVYEQERKILKTNVDENAQVYTDPLSVEGHKKNAPKVGIKDVNQLDVKNISAENAAALGVSHQELARLGLGRMDVGELVAGYGNDKKGTVQGINVTKASELSDSGVSLNLNDVIFLRAKQNGGPLSKPQRDAIAANFDPNGANGINATQLIDFKSKLAEVKRNSVRDFSRSVYASLNTDEKSIFLKNAGVKDESELAQKLKTSNPEELHRIFKFAEATNSEKTGLKSEGYIGRQHVMDSQKALSDRVETLQAGAANLTILAGNASKSKDGKIVITGNDGEKGNLSDLSHFYNGSFVNKHDDIDKIVADYRSKNGGKILGADGKFKPLAENNNEAFSAIVKEQHNQTLAVYKEANKGSEIKTFEDLAQKAGSGHINENVAKAIVFSSNEQIKVADILSGKNEGLKLSSAGSKIYPKNNDVLQKNLANIQTFAENNNANAEAIKTGSNVKAIKTGDAVSDQVSLTINGEEKTGSVGDQVGRIKTALGKENGNVSISAEAKANILDVLRKANPSDPAIADLEKTFRSIKDKASIVAQNAGAVGTAKAETGTGTTDTPDAKTTVAQVDQALKTPAAGKPKDDLLERFLDIGNKASSPEEEKGKSKIQEALDALSNKTSNIAKVYFQVADEILSRLNKEVAGSFDYGFGHGNGGRITNRIGGAGEQDKDAQGNTISNVTEVFQGGINTGNRTKAAFDTLTRYNKNREAEARDGSVSIREGVRRYNDNIEKYVAGSTSAEKSQIRGKYAMDFPLTEATKNEPAKYGQSTALKSPIEEQQAGATAIQATTNTPLTTTQQIGTIKDQLDKAKETTEVGRQ